MKKVLIVIVGLTSLFFSTISLSEAQDIRIVNITFPGPAKPKTQVDKKHNWYTNHFSVSSQYKMEVVLKANIPPNASFQVGTYAHFGGQLVLLGDTRVGRAQSSDNIIATYNIFPSSANYYGQCQFVVIADSYNEILETDERESSNKWIFQATIHPPGATF